MEAIEKVADRLAAMYSQPFGGKATGRYRLSQKFLRDLLGRRRVYPEEVVALTRALLERGFVLVDMETFYVVLSASAFVNYRRAGKEASGTTTRAGTRAGGRAGVATAKVPT